MSGVHRVHTKKTDGKSNKIESDIIYNVHKIIERR